MPDPVPGMDPSQILTRQADLNLGNALEIPPRSFALGAGDVDPIRIIETSAPDQETSIATIAMSVSTVNRNATALTLAPPMVGIVEFTVAGALHRIEFNINANVLGGPNGVITPVLGFPAQNVPNGVAISVPGSTFRVFAKNESRAPSPIDGLPITTIDGSTDAGRFQVAASISFLPVGTNHPIRRTFLATSAAGTLPDGSFFIITIPPFAKAVRFPRSPLATTTLFVSFQGPNGTYDQDVAAGSQGSIEIDPTWTFMSVTNNTGGAVAIGNLAVQFDVGL